MIDNVCVNIAQINTHRCRQPDRQGLGDVGDTFPEERRGTPETYLDWRGVGCPVCLIQ